MPQSLSSILIHLIFSTKNREPFINETIETELHPYLAQIFRELKSPSLAINGTSDHIHLALSALHGKNEANPFLGRRPRLLHFAPLALRKKRSNYFSWPLLSSCSPPLRSGRMCGNRITSRIDCLFVASMTKRSMPMPIPAAGGMP